MTLLGKSGIQELGELNMDRAFALREKISSLKGFRVNPSIPIFNEFVVRSDKPFREIEARLLQEKIFPGIDLSAFYPELKNQFLVCATETKTAEDLDRFVEALEKC